MYIQFNTLAATICVLSLLFTSPSSAGNLKETVDQSANFIEKLSKDDQWKGAINLLGAAKAVVIVTDIKKAAFIIGFESGNGVLVSRKGDQWSDPLAINLKATSIAFQAGVQSADALLVILTRQALDEFMDGVFKVGGTGGFALGGWGVSGRAGGSLSGGIEVLTLSLSKGLFAGGGLEGVTISPDDESNLSVYGENSANVLSTTGGAFKNADKLRGLLTKAVQNSWNE